MTAYPPAAIKAIGVEDVQAQLGKVGVIIVDLRLPFDYFGGRIPGAINLPATLVQERIGEFTLDKHLIFVCDNGEESRAAAGGALALGFSDVSVLDGGLDVWFDAGLPIETISDGTVHVPPALLG